MRSRLLPALLLLAVMLAGPPPAVAGDLADRALALVAMPYDGFLALKRRAPGPPFDWSTDGCSRTPKRWARRFDGPCQQHDFGYRNLGRGLRLRRTERTRIWVDRRLLDESRRVCARNLRRAARLLCVAAAQTMHAAVRIFQPRWG